MANKQNKLYFVYLVPPIRIRPLVASNERERSTSFQGCPYFCPTPCQMHSIAPFIPFSSTTTGLFQWMRIKTRRSSIIQETLRVPCRIRSFLQINRPPTPISPISICYSKGWVKSHLFEELHFYRKLCSRLILLFFAFLCRVWSC